MAKADHPSRELDVKVAKALGWFGPVTWVDDQEGRDPYMYEPTILHRDWLADRKPETRGERNHVVPHFSASISDAWPLIDALNAAGVARVELLQQAGGWRVRRVEMPRGDYEIVEEFDGTTVEMALCNAFLGVNARDRGQEDR